MTISTDFNYADKLAFDKAKLINRIRLNFLGSQEMVLDYSNITSAMREDAVEWLEAETGANARGVAEPMINPTFGFKTYEGSWNCIEITYNEDKNTIRQRFKIDSSLGTLDGSSGTMLGTGDGSRISAGMDIERAYYWRVVDPDSVDLPPSAPNGEIYTKSAQDNGDGTYDVVITKEVATNLTATSKVQAGNTLAHGHHLGGYTETTEVSTNDDEQDFFSSGGVVSDSLPGEIKRIDNTPLENGKFRSTVTTREAIPQRMPPLTASGGPNYPWLEYGSDFIQDANNIIVGKNQTWDSMIQDRDRTNVSPAIFKINSMSVRLNDYGLYDYTIVSNSPG